MIIYLAHSPSDLVGGHGHSNALLTVGYPDVLISFAEDAMRRRMSILPPPGDKAWERNFDITNYVKEPSHDNDQP